MKNKCICLLVIMGMMACSQQQRVSTHTPPMDYGDKGPDRYSDQLMNKLERGIDFIASGNEPFWSLEIDIDNNITFKTLQGDSLVAKTPQAIIPKDIAATRYQVKIGTELLNIVIHDKSCVDNMSGKELSKTVEVTLADKRFTGCGTFLSDYRLNDIWVLERINETRVDPVSFPRGLPRMELNLTMNQVFAFTGCNEFSSAIEIQGKRIRFGRFSGTLMACKNMNFESVYLSNLANKTIPFLIEPGKLALLVGKDSTYHYKKVD